MTDSKERRYGDDEIREIFDVAAAEAETEPRSGREQGSGGSTSSSGLTLAELQEVGLEAGLPPERIAAAAAALDARPPALPRQTSLGAPTGVQRAVELPREATEREWQILVGELRDTFQARGQVEVRGDMKVWRNGNLFAALEPTADGQRLRMGTKKAGSKEVNRAGIFMLVVGLILLVTRGLDAATFGALGELLVPGLAVLGGGSALAWNRLRLAAWADERERQMEHIGQRAQELLQSPPADE